MQQHKPPRGAEQPQAASEFPGVTRTILQRCPTPDGKRELVLVEVTYAPGTKAPPHRHPVGGLVYILEGMAESAYGDDTPHRHHAGDAVHDDNRRVHTIFRNCDPEQPLRFLTFYVLAPGQAYAVPA